MTGTGARDNNFVITAELKRRGRSYDGLQTQIELLSSAWLLCHESVWIITSALTSEELLAALLPQVDPYDYLLIAHLGSGDVVGQLRPRASEWLHVNL